MLVLVLVLLLVLVLVLLLPLPLLLACPLSLFVSLSLCRLVSLQSSFSPCLLPPGPHRPADGPSEPPRLARKARAEDYPV